MASSLLDRIIHSPILNQTTLLATLFVIISELVSYETIQK